MHRNTPCPGPAPVVLLAILAWSTNVSAELTGVGSIDAAPLVAPSAAGSAHWVQLPPPGGRSGHTAVFDFRRNRMILFGGFDRAYRNDVWVLSLSGPAQWTAVATRGLPPPARSMHTAIYDPRGDRMIVFGGGPGVPDAGVWALGLTDPPTWSRITPTGTGPEARRGHTAVYDPVRDRMIVFGGFGEDLFNDVWSLSLRSQPTWTLEQPLGTPPGPRYQHTAVYQPFQHRILVFGGFDGRYRNDVWVLSLRHGMTWDQLVTEGTAPAIRGGHVAVLDRVPDPEGVDVDYEDRPPDRMVVFGGYNGVRLNDAWVLSLGRDDPPAWTRLQPFGNAPTPRRGGSAIFDPARRRMLVFGGEEGGPNPNPMPNEVVALNLGVDPSSWETVAPAPRLTIGHSLIYDPIRHRMIMFGGGTAEGGPKNDTWSYSLGAAPGWSLLYSPGQPSPRTDHSAIYDPVRDRMLVYGGNVIGTSMVGEVFELRFDTFTWRRFIPAGTAPPRRAFHSAIYDPVRDRMIVYGGARYNGSGYDILGDVWELSLSDPPTWTQIVPSGGAGLEPSMFHTAMYDALNDRMIVWGVPNCSDGVWTLTFTGYPTWTVIGAFGPACWYSPQAVFDSEASRMLLLGGISRTELWGLPLSGPPNWSLLAPAPVRPEPDWINVMILDSAGDRLVVFQGYRGEVWSMDLTGGAVAMSGAQGDARMVKTTGASAAVQLSAAYPNPTRDGTSFDLLLTRPVELRAGIYDLAGRQVGRLAAGHFDAGVHRIHWDGRLSGSLQAAPGGLYFCRVEAGDAVVRRSFVVIP